MSHLHNAPLRPGSFRSVIALAACVLSGSAGCSSSSVEGGATSGSGGTSAPAGSGGTSAPAGSDGTSAPTGSGGTSAPAGSGGTSAPTGSGGTSAPAGSGGTSAPAGSGGTSAPAGSGGNTSSGGAGMQGGRGGDAPAVGSGGGGGRGGVAGQTGQGGTTSTGAAGQPGSGGPPDHKEIIAYNDANGGQLLYLNKTTPSRNWTVNSGSGRDLQLVGNGRVMLGKSSGWEEYQLSNGMRVASVSSLSSSQAAHRLADGLTMVASTSGDNILLRFANATGAVQRQITYKGYNYVRYVRPTAGGTYMVTADDKVFEGNDQGEVIWEVTIPGGSGRHVWKAMRFANGDTGITTGYDKKLRIYGADRTLKQTIGGGAEVTPLIPKFFADFHVMPNGNYFVVNSQADSPDPGSTQLLEFSPAGALVWQQKQPNGVGSLEAAIVLDGLDTSKLHVEPEGVIVPAP